MRSTRCLDPQARGRPCSARFRRDRRHHWSIAPLGGPRRAPSPPSAGGPGRKICEISILASTCFTTLSTTGGLRPGSRREASPSRDVSVGVEEDVASPSREPLRASGRSRTERTADDRDHGLKTCPARLPPRLASAAPPPSPGAGAPAGEAAAAPVTAAAGVSACGVSACGGVSGCAGTGSSSAVASGTTCSSGAGPPAGAGSTRPRRTGSPRLPTLYRPPRHPSRSRAVSSQCW